MSVQKVTSHRKTADLSDWGILLPHAHSAGWTWAWESSYLTHLLPRHGQLYLPSVPILSPPPGSHPPCGGSTVRSAITDQGEERWGWGGNPPWARCEGWHTALAAHQSEPVTWPRLLAAGLGTWWSDDTHRAVRTCISITQDSKRNKPNPSITLPQATLTWASKSPGRLTRQPSPSPLHLSDMIIAYELNNQIDVRAQGNALIIKNTKDKVYCDGLRLRRNPVWCLGNKNQ